MSRRTEFQPNRFLVNFQKLASKLKSCNQQKLLRKSWGKFLSIYSRRFQLEVKHVIT